MKGKDGFEIYFEDPIPSEFRIAKGYQYVRMWFIGEKENGKTKRRTFYMPCMLAGWVKDEVHVQIAVHSLQ